MSTAPRLALTIQQPWAWLILNAGMDVINMNWSSSVRGRFIIHASRNVDLAALQTFASILPSTPLTTGAFVGTAEMIGCVPARRCESGWASDYGHCFLLRDPKPFLVPIPGKGTIRFFAVPDGTEFGDESASD